MLADVNDRVSSQTQQLASSVGWSKDILEMQLQQDSLRMEVGGAPRLARTQFHAHRRRGRARPNIGPGAGRAEQQVTQLIYTMTIASITPADFDRQRDELQRM